MLIVDNGTPIDVGDVTSKDITGLTAGSSHSYVVKSVNEGGISESSSPINVTLKTDAPVATDSTNINQTSFTANWGPVSGATSYKLKVDNGSFTDVRDVTSYPVTGLTPATTHTYPVQASNVTGTSANSNPINVNTIPVAPVASSATDITDISIVYISIADTIQQIQN